MTISDAIANTSHTHSITLRSLVEVQPRGEVVEHLVVVSPRRTESKTMTTSRIDIKSTIVTHATHSRIISDGIGNGRHHAIIISCDDNGRRREMTYDSVLVREQLHQLFILLSFLPQEVLARTLVTLALVHRDDRIEQNREVGTAVILTMGRHSGSQVATSREAHDTHVLWVNMPGGSRITHHADGILRITHGNGTVAARHTIG